MKHLSEISKHYRILSKVYSDNPLLGICFEMAKNHNGLVNHRMGLKSDLYILKVKDHLS